MACWNGRPCFACSTPSRGTPAIRRIGIEPLRHRRVVLRVRLEMHDVKSTGYNTHTDLILRSGPKDRVSKDGDAAHASRRALRALLSMRSERCGQVPSR